MMPQTFDNGYSHKETSFHNMIFLSVVAHVIVIAIVFVSVPTASRHFTFGPVYSVSLVSSEVVLPGKQESSLIKEINKSNETAGSVILKKEISNFAATPVKKEEMGRLNVEKAIIAIKQKELAAPATSAGAKPAARATDPTGAKIPESAVAAQRQEYVGIVWSRIQKNWTLPPTLMPKENIETVIAVRIARSGGLELVNFEKRSGNSYFDDAALKTIKKSSPFPPFPSRLSDESIEIGIRFHPSQFR
jgi:colicin import membrane protein